MEFIILTITGFFILLTTILAAATLSQEKQAEKTFIESDDLGRSIQQELIIAANLEDGYKRNFLIPSKLQNSQISITNNITSKNTGYISITFENTELYYETPKLNGSIRIGNNTIEKIDNALYINR